jgi:hypothetical protein
MIFPISRRKRLPRSRRLVCDLLHFAQHVPLFPLERSCFLGELADLRQRCLLKVSWPVLFLKAYGLLALDYPVLRQAFLRWPWPHLYEHPCSVAMLAINRTDRHGDRLYWGRFRQPERQPLGKLQLTLEKYKTGQPKAVFARQIRISRAPTLLRRLGLWWTLNVSGVSRARRVGTFGLSTLASTGAVNRYHPTCLTTSLTYGPLDSSGQALVTILYDHRVVDGNCIAHALCDLEAILRGPIAHELASTCDPNRAVA